ncbi:MAG: hypothetical protein ABI557_07960, partial [Aureliella sp.]
MLSRETFKPRFEQLEMRRVLAAVTWDGGAFTNEWGDAANWNTDTLPGLGDDVIIPDLAGTPTIKITQALVPAVSVNSITSAERIEIGSLTLVTLTSPSTFNNGLDFAGPSTFTAQTVDIYGSSVWNLPDSNDAQFVNHGNVDLTTYTPGSSFGSIQNFGTFNVMSSGPTPNIIDTAISNEVGATFFLDGRLSGTSPVVNLGLLFSSNGSIEFSLDNSGIFESTGTTNISGTITQYVGSALLAGNWIADFGTIAFPAAGAPITTIGPSALVSTTSNHFPKINNVATVDGILHVVSGGFFTPAGDLVNYGRIEVGSAGVLLLNPGNSLSNIGGTLALDSGEVSTNAIEVSGGGRIEGNGLLSAVSVNISDGTLSPGTLLPANPLGSFGISGDLVLGANSHLEIDVAGTNSANPDFDQLDVTGAVLLGGTLTVSLLNSFVPDVSETFRFLTFASSSGAFITFDLPRPNGQNLFSEDLGATYYDLLGDAYIVRNTNNSGPYSLRQAITAANARNGLDQILFSIPVAGTHTITPTTELPNITDPLIMDASTQLGYGGTPLIELDGSSIVTPTDGLYVNTNNSLIKGLAIVNWSFAGVIFNGNSNRLQSSYIGLRADGTTAGGNAVGGVWIYPGSNNFIGTDGDGVDDAAEGNVISGNMSAGIYLQSGSLNNVIAGNIVGLNAAGTASAGIQSYGVWLSDDAVDATRIGTDGNGVSDVWERNLISGNTDLGIRIDGSDHSIIAGNLLGTDALGTTLIASAQSGISLGPGTDHTRIGTDANSVSDTLERNVVVGGTGNVTGNNFGIALSGAGTTLNTIAGNYIGLLNDGLTAAPNATGVLIQDDATNNTFGGTTVVARNIISGNGGFGLALTGSGTSGNTVAGNWIGIASDGLTAVGNGDEGIEVDGGAHHNTIGGNTTGSANVISGNAYDGVGMFTGANYNTVRNNFIGTDPTGNTAIANLGNGVTINGSDHNQILDNVASGNVYGGVVIFGATATDNTIAGNYIGTNFDGSSALGNGAGIQIESAGLGNVIGVDGDGVADSKEGNVISGNLVGGGVFIDQTSGVVVAGNIIGMDKTGMAILSNVDTGAGN